MLAKSEPTDADQREQQKLAKLLESRIPPSAANLIARRAQELLESLDNNAQQFLGSLRESAIDFNALEQEIYDRMGALRKALDGGKKRD